MQYDIQNLTEGIAAAETDDLLDRVTAYRSGMEPVAIELIEKELRRRGINASQIAAHDEACVRTCIFSNDGMASMCSFCRKPAIQEGWGWHKIWGMVPVVPRWLRYCAAHAEKTKPPRTK